MQSLNSATVTLIIPDILSHGDGILSDSRHLNWILARSRRETLETSVWHFVANQFAVIDYNCAAALSLYHRGFNCEEQYSCFADPVNIQPNRDHLSITQVEFNDLSADEVKSYIQELNHHFAEEKIQFLALQPLQWACILPEKIVMPEVPSKSIVNQNILEHIPLSKENIGFKKLFSDVQMMLHHSPTNQERSWQGKIEINSLWLHDIGRLPETVVTNLHKVSTDNEALLALAQLSGIEHCTEFNLNELITDAARGDLLVYFSCFSQKGTLDDDFFKTLFYMVKQNKLAKLRLIFDEHILFEFDSRNAKKFWKRKYKTGR